MSFISPGDALGRLGPGFGHFLLLPASSSTLLFFMGISSSLSSLPFFKEKNRGRSISSFSISESDPVCCFFVLLRVLFLKLFLPLLLMFLLCLWFQLLLFFGLLVAAAAFSAWAADHFHVEDLLDAEAADEADFRLGALLGLLLIL